MTTTSQVEQALQRENDRLLNTIRVQAAAIEVMQADAARYRWIVSQIVSDNFDRLESAFARFGDAMSCTSDEFNAAIDAAMKETK